MVNGDIINLLKSVTQFPNDRLLRVKYKNDSQILTYSAHIINTKQILKI